jgi:hypothetical protein
MIDLFAVEGHEQYEVRLSRWLDSRQRPFQAGAI